jgi:hypothetical protein
MTSSVRLFATKSCHKLPSPKPVAHNQARPPVANSRPRPVAKCESNPTILGGTPTGNNIRCSVGGGGAESHHHHLHGSLINTSTVLMFFIQEKCLC